MNRNEFVQKCQMAVDMSGDMFDRAIGRLIGDFAISIMKYEPNGLPDYELIPMGLAEAYVALMMMQLKYAVPQDKVDAAIEERLTPR